jgi:signal transduction histidine kinase/CheY-like chemotaxis protein
MRAADGSWVWIQARGKVSQRSANGKAIRISGTNTDITERKRADEERERLQEQLAQSQKLEGLGRLAGGVAHDFNNLLTVINGYSDIVFSELAEDDPLRASVEQVCKAGARAAELTRQLLAFGRKQLIHPVALDLNFVIADSQTMLRRLLREDVELVIQLGPGLGQITADNGQIHQVLMNLAANARDAMPDGGKLTIETANVSAAGFPEAAGTPGVRLSVTDSGMGIDDNTRKLIFEPFFTTKPVGAGTGLGLAMVYGIVKQSQGFIDVQSELGKGTRFDIYWPRTDSVETPAQILRPAGTGQPVSGTILLVEDQDEVRGFATTVLRRHGFAVIAAAGGRQALDLIEGGAGPIDLMLTDVVMPGMNGRELAAQVRRIRPGIRVLYTSGFSSEASAAQGVLADEDDYLPKPYDANTLFEKVIEALSMPQKNVTATP